MGLEQKRQALFSVHPILSHPKNIHPLKILRKYYPE